MHVVGTNYDQEFRYQLKLQYRYMNGDWQNADITTTAQTNGTYLITLPFNDRASLGMRIRIVLRCAYASGGNVGDRADLSVAAAVRFWTN